MTFERERLEGHFETQLEELGVPLRPDVRLTLISDEEWPKSGLRSVLAGFVNVAWEPILEFPEGLPTVGGDPKPAIVVPGVRRLEFRSFELWAPAVPYSWFLGTAIHEAAHVMRWRELMGEENRITDTEMARAQKELHGWRFRELDNELLGRARELGMRRRNFVPDEVAHLFAAPV